MKIVHFNNSDCLGGAARAAFRLHRGLLEAGHDSTMLVLRRASSLPSVHLWDQPRTGRDRAWDFISLEEIHLNRTPLSNTLFSYARGSFDPSTHPLVQDADILQLHWVADFLAPRAIGRLQSLGKPLVWTLHDQRPLTGGCHYTAGCAGYTSDCLPCPQLAADPCRMAARSLHDQLTLYRGREITVVGPSRWLADSARRSRIFREADVRHIPYGLETDVFCPQSRAAARAKLGLPATGIVIAFGADNSFEQRKGVHVLGRALTACAREPRFAAGLRSRAITLLAFGPLLDGIFPRELPLHSTGYLGSDDAMATVYAAADLYVLPSLEDNLPNTVLEAMACGAAVAGFAIGGVPDLVSEGLTGGLAPAGDAGRLAEIILALTAEPIALAEMGARGRSEIEARYTMAHQAQAYGALYTELAGRPAVAARDTDLPSAVEAQFPRLLLRAARSLPRRLSRRALRFLRRPKV